jgi:hypothetical protein
MDAMVEAFGYENKARVQRFYSDWEIAKKKLRGQLPQTFENLKPEQRPQVRVAILDFLTAIKQQNAEFLNPLRR